MAISGFRVERGGIKGLLSDPGVKKLLQQRAEAVASQARANAPVGVDHSAADGPRLRDSIEVQSGVRNGRAYSRVVANKSYASKIDTAWLASAADAAGF